MTSKLKELLKKELKVYFMSLYETGDKFDEDYYLDNTEVASSILKHYKNSLDFIIKEGKLIEKIEERHGIFFNDDTLESISEQSILVALNTLSYFMHEYMCDSSIDTIDIEKVVMKYM